ncbi:uL30 family ribosomal protein [Candidatus Micrarchaeota archaeon]|nr:uL30 family ribosomal protein [Candidatus Micrarchaeota archaeon]MBI5177357.1 uL30 family ribosomal protein [Candidatus Micrarchaeota archaeon]
MAQTEKDSSAKGKVRPEQTEKNGSAKAGAPAGKAKGKSASQGAKLIVAIRVRGLRGVRWAAETTLNQLGGGGLRRNHGCVLVANSPSAQGMLREAKDYIAWGEADASVVEKLLEKRGNADSISKSGFTSAKELATALAEGKVSPSEVRRKGVSTIFTLHPPRDGFGSSIKGQYDAKEGRGVLGDRGGKISSLVTQML